MAEHLPVMLQETVAALSPRPGGTVVDGTLGLGGHAESLLEKLGPDGLLIGIDRDPAMLARAQERLARFGAAFRAVHARLTQLRPAVRGIGAEPVDGILLDLGLCSAQLDDPARGFSFREQAKSAPLDMRMDPASGRPASALLAETEQSELEAVLREGGIPQPRRVARAILAKQPMRTVADLLEAVEGLHLPRRRHHPATLVFQALRIWVNEELADLERALESGAELLASGGRLAVLSYHSGEDRRVKEFFAREVRGCICPPDLPVCGCGRVARFRHTVRAARPSPAEIERNPRSRSAHLRAGERL